MRDVADLLGIRKLTSTAYHHQTIGALENAHKTLRASRADLLLPDRINLNSQPFTWSEWILFWTFMYNTTVHSSRNYTPFELMFGRRCILLSLV